MSLNLEPENPGLESNSSDIAKNTDFLKQIVIQLQYTNRILQAINIQLGAQNNNQIDPNDVDMTSFGGI